MKKCFLILMILVGFLAPISAQMVDTTGLEQRVANIEENMANFHRDYTVGTKCILVGGGMTVASVIGWTVMGKPSALTSGGILVGGLISLIGTAIQWDSHRHFKDSRVGIHGNKVIIKVN